MKAFQQVLLIFSIPLLLLASCSPPALREFARKPKPEHRFIPVFNETFEKSLYTVNLTFGQQSLTGIVIIKHVEKKESFRMVCMAETGLKYFDLEFFQNDSSVVHYIMDVLNRKKIVDLLRSDIGLLFYETALIDKKVTYFESVNSSEGFVVKQRKMGRNYFYYQQQGLPPSKIFHQSFLSSGVFIQTDYDSEHRPIEIILFGEGKSAMELKLIPKR
jgi:hypothetical protein